MQSINLPRIIIRSPNSSRPAFLVIATTSSSPVSKFSTSNSQGPRNKNNLPAPAEINLAGLKRGTGGRSSFNGIVATVFGASGFVGRYVCNRLGKLGTQVVVPYRGEHYDVLRLKLVGDLGQVLFFPFQLRDEESLRKAMKHSNVVINLMSRDWETSNFKFKDVNVTGARAVARIARECGVKRLIHFSSLNVKPNPQGLLLSEGSEFLKTKYAGEQAVKEEFPDVTIFRPADIYGQEDRFMRYYAHFWRRTFQWLPLWHRGERTVKQPVYVGDVAQGVVNALRDPESVGKTYDIVGPHRYQLSELVDFFFRTMRRDEEWGYRRTDIRFSPLFQMRVSATQKFCPSWPVAYLGWDKLERDHITDEPTLGNPTLSDLGVPLETIENRADWELKPFRALSYYDDALGEFPKPPLPKHAVEY